MTEESEAIKNQIKETLDGAFYKYVQDDDGDIYVNEGVEFPIWIDVEKNMIKFFTNIDFKSDHGTEFDSSKADSLVNRMNMGTLPNSFFHDNKAIHSTYYLPILDGFSPINFIEMLRRTSGSFIFGIRKHDQDELIA